MLRNYYLKQIVMSRMDMECGVTRPSGLVHWICVLLMAESSACGFEP